MSRALIVLSAVLALQPASAWACSQAPLPPTLRGQPADKDVDVPTNVVLRYALPAGTVRYDDPPDLVPGKYVLHSAEGEEIELNVTRKLKFQLELTPAQPLRPNTAYIIEAYWTVPASTEADSAVRFETGDGPSEETPEPPSGTIRSYELAMDHTAACGPQRKGTCLSVQDDESLIEYTMIDLNGDEQGSHLVRGSSFTSALYGSGAGFNCVDMRRIAPSGARSEPQRLCFDEAPLSDLTELVDKPKVRCAATGLKWCDSSGKKGWEPGPTDARGVDGELFCDVPSDIGKNVLAQDTELPEDAGVVTETPAAPAAGSCSATAAPRSTGGLGLLTLLAGLAVFQLRRRTKRAAA